MEMIYNQIVNAIQNFLGGDYYLEYANNHDIDWAKMLPEAQEETKFGVLRVDSGTTTQVGGQAIRTEQLRLIVAIPEDREIFNQAVVNLRSMLTGLNQQQITDSEENVTALLTFGEYHDASCQTVNSNRWWISEVTFIANFYNSVSDFQNVYVSLETAVTVNGVTSNVYSRIDGVINVKYGKVKNYDPNIYVANPSIVPSLNSVQETIQIDLVYISSYTLLDSIISETNNEATYNLKYTNNKFSRYLTCYLTSISESTITGDILRATMTFTKV